MKEILANTGWAYAREHMEKFDGERLAEKLDNEETETNSATGQNRWTDTAMELTAHQNFELLKSASARGPEAQGHRPLSSAICRTRMIRGGNMRGRRNTGRQTYSVTGITVGQRRNTRHKPRAAKSKTDKPPSRVPPDEKTLTVKMPQTAGSSQPVPLWHQASSTDEASSSEQLTSASSASASSDAKMPSPTKTPGELDDSDLVDPLKHLHKHFIPNKGGTSAPAEQTSGEGYDPRAIEDMEADYTGQHST